MKTFIAFILLPFVVVAWAFLSWYDNSLLGEEFID